MTNNTIVEKTGDTYYFLISHNEIIEVDNITDKDIKDGGKYSTWENYITWDKFEILDKDYWKSPELMRMLLAPKIKKTNFIKYIIVWGVTLLIFILTVVVFSYNSNTAKITNNTWIINKEVIPKHSEVIPIKKEVVPIKENIQNKDSWFIGFSQPLKSKDQINFEKTAKMWEIDRLILENTKLREENTKLTIENTKLKENIQSQNIVNKDLTLEAFKMYLGNIVYKQCEKTWQEGLINKCKDLYYKYVQND